MRTHCTLKLRAYTQGLGKEQGENENHPYREFVFSPGFVSVTLDRAKKKNTMKPQNQKGLTLIELMTVLAIIASLSLVAMPNLFSWLPDHRLKRAARELHSNMQLAKLTAVKTNTCCTIVFNQDAGGRRYDYVVFEDADNDLEFDEGEKIVERVLWSDYKSVRQDSSKTSGGVTFPKNDERRHTVSFRPNGLPIDNAGNLGSGTVFLTNTHDRKKSVVVSPAGNIRIESE